MLKPLFSYLPLYCTTLQKLFRLLCKSRKLSAEFVVCVPWWLLFSQSYCYTVWPAVHPSVMLCIVVLSIIVGGWKLYHHIPRMALPIHFFRHFCYRVYRLATINVGCIFSHNTQQKTELPHIWNSHGQHDHGYSGCGIFSGLVFQLYYASYAVMISLISKS